MEKKNVLFHHAHLYHYYYLTLLRVFQTSVSWRFLTGVSANLFGSYQCSGPSSQWRCVHLFSYFQVFQSLYHFFEHSFKCTSYNWHQCIFHVHSYLVLLIGLATSLSLGFLSIRSSLATKSTEKFFFYSCWVFFFCFSWLSQESGLLAEIRWPVCIAKSLRTSCVSFFRTDFVLCIYYLFVCLNVHLSNKSLWNTFPAKLCLVL